MVLGDSGLRFSVTSKSFLKSMPIASARASAFSMRKVSPLVTALMVCGLTPDSLANCCLEIPRDSKRLLKIGFGVARLLSARAPGLLKFM